MRIFRHFLLTVNWHFVLVFGVYSQIIIVAGPQASERNISYLPLLVREEVLCDEFQSTIIRDLYGGEEAQISEHPDFQTFERIKITNRNYGEITVTVY